MRAFARSSCICRVIGCAPPYTRFVVRTVRSIISIFYGCRLTRFAGAGAHVELVAVPGGREREEEGSGERAHLCGEWNDLLISSPSYRRRAVVGPEH